MSARLIGIVLMALGAGVLALAGADFMGWGIGLDGNTPALAAGAVLIALGWMKFGEKPTAPGERPASIADRDPSPH